MGNIAFPPKENVDKEGLEAVYETIEAEDIDPSNTELVELHLRDSLIKSFMVIFTNEQS
jgi:hypothetical protein